MYIHFFGFRSGYDTISSSGLSIYTIPKRGKDANADHHLHERLPMAGLILKVGLMSKRCSCATCCYTCSIVLYVYIYIYL